MSGFARKTMPSGAMDISDMYAVGSIAQGLMLMTPFIVQGRSYGVSINVHANTLDALVLQQGWSQFVQQMEVNVLEYGHSSLGRFDAALRTVAYAAFGSPHRYRRLGPLFRRVKMKASAAPPLPNDALNDDESGLLERLNALRAQRADIVYRLGLAVRQTERELVRIRGRCNICGNGHYPHCINVMCGSGRDE